MKGKNNKRVLYIIEKTYCNQNLLQMSHQRNKFLGSPPCKTLRIVLETDKETTQINRPECYIAIRGTILYVNMWNVHRMFITHIGIAKHKKHLRLLRFRYETFYYLWVKRFFDIRSEIPSFNADFSICPKPRVTPAARPRRASESQPSSSEAKLN